MLNWEQIDAARVIVEELYKRPLASVLDRARSTGALSLALLTNAYAESRLHADIQSGYVDPRTGEREDSWGLFQLNRRGGVGRGWTAAQLIDPRLNTQLILAEMVRQDAATGLITATAERGTVGDLVAIFAAEVERPANRHEKGRERAQLARELWGPSLIDRPAMGG